MLWIDIIKDILYDIASGMVFSIILAAILYTSYLTVVRGGPHLHKLVNIANAANVRAYNNRVDAKMRCYRETTNKTGIVSTVIPLIIVVIFAHLFYSQIVFFAVVGSGSMEPTLMTGDLVLIQNIHVKPQVGDILMFETKTVLIPVIHRVVSVSERGVRTKGDARKRADDWIVSEDQICGKSVVIGGNPIVIKSIGSYFIEDAREGGMYTKYGKEYGFVKNVVLSIKSFGLIIFFLCILMYILSAKRS
ncbi:MAG TPA: signal peptidase I [Methanosarcinales archaeon]|nr:signal peptidase I [Methanosarcinales archaeon]